MIVALLLGGCGRPAPVGGPPLELGMSASPGPGPTQVELRVTSSRPAPVAVACEAEGDRHLGEGGGAVSDHVVRLSGLLPDTTYDCVAAVPGLPPFESTRLTWTTSPSPVVSLQPEVPDPAAVWGAWTLAVWTRTCDASTDSYLVVWDLEGRPRWWWLLPEDVNRGVEARWHPELGAIVWGGGTSPDGNVRYVDPWEGERFAASIPGLEGVTFHHDGKRTSDGRILALYDARDTDGTSSWLGFGVDLFDPATGAVDLRVRSQDWLDELADARGGGADPYHANWADLAEGPGGPELWISLCFAWRILRVDAVSGALLDAFGPDLGWSVRGEDGAPLDQGELPQCQHGVEVEGDRLLVYDNGRGRGQSRVSEWRLDQDRREAALQWSWTEPGWFLPALGDVDALPGALGGGSAVEGEHLLLGRFALGCEEGRSQLTEVDRADGSVVGRWWFPEEADNSYRAERIDGCELFTSADACPERAELHEALFGR